MKTKNTLKLLVFCCILFSSKLINAQCHIDDWTALKALYEATDGDNWKNNTGWEIVKNDERPSNCNLNGLYGVRRDENARVKKLSLFENNLNGKIPQGLNKLEQLELLSLSTNKLSGNIPPDLGQLANLRNLVLYQNQLSGNIPPELGMLNNLYQLELFENLLSGSIPPELGNLVSLSTLDFKNNKLSGSIPSELGKLPELAFFDLDNNLLSGNIPPELGNLSNLFTLDLSSNQLSGSIPTELGNLSNLRELFLNENQLSGSIPAQLGDLSNLDDLVFTSNRLSGNIPPEIGNMVKLRYLDLNSNQLSGSIPPEIGNLDNLYSLDLNSNQLSGNIPSTIANLELDYFNISNNQLSGAIPNLNPQGNSVLLNFYLSFNNFSCEDIKNFYYEDFYLEYWGYSQVFDFVPQNYSQDDPQSFILEDSLTAISLSVPINITGNFEYQWYINELAINGATDSILVLNSVQLDDVGEYTLRIIDVDCKLEFYYNNYYYEFISDPISVRRTDLEGCTDQNSCNYNQFAFIDDGSCEYIWCDTMTNPIKIRTTNETILSDTQIKFDVVIDSLDLDYSADGLTFTLDTRGNYRIESIDVVNPILSVAEVDISKLYKNTLSIDRINNQRLASNEPILSAVACIIVEDIPTDESTCSHFVISGGTELASGHFIDFDNVYIDIPFSDCSPYGEYGTEGENWLPLVLSINPQNCSTATLGLAEIKILEEGLSPFSYTLKNEQGEIVLEATSNDKLIEVSNLNAGNYELTVFDMDGKKTTLHTCIPLVASLDGNENCNTHCVDYVIVPDGEITGLHQAKKEIEIKGFVGITETVEFDICE